MEIIYPSTNMNTLNIFQLLNHLKSALFLQKLIACKLLD